MDNTDFAGIHEKSFSTPSFREICVQKEGETDLRNIFTPFSPAT
jgi:hypothetical protein